MGIALEDLVDYQHLVPKSVSKRSEKGKREFILGRLCAQVDLDDIQFIDRDETGKPVWPKGLVGSISHSKDFAIAAHSVDKRIKSIGIDIERLVDDKRVSVIKKMTLTESELRFLDSFQECTQKEIATILFSAKETLYKLINPLSHCFINFHEGIFRNYNEKTGEYQIELSSDKRELKPFLGIYTGHVFKIDKNIVTVSVLSH